MEVIQNLEDIKSILVLIFVIFLKMICLKKLYLKQIYIYLFQKKRWTALNFGLRMWFDLRWTFHVANWVMTSVVYIGTLGSLDWTAGSGLNDEHKVLYKSLDYNVLFIYLIVSFFLTIYS